MRWRRNDPDLIYVTSESNLDFWNFMTSLSMSLLNSTLFPIMVVLAYDWKEGTLPSAECYRTTTHQYKWRMKKNISSFHRHVWFITKLLRSSTMDTKKERIINFYTSFLTWKCVSSHHTLAAFIKNIRIRIFGECVMYRIQDTSFIRYI